MLEQEVATNSKIYEENVAALKQSELDSAKTIAQFREDVVCVISYQVFGCAVK
jgi:hypothetical protein